MVTDGLPNFHKDQKEPQPKISFILSQDLKVVPKDVQLYLNIFCIFFRMKFSTQLLATRMQKLPGSVKIDQNTSFVSPLVKDELLALLAVLVMSAVKNDNHLSAKQMFDSTISGSFYKSCMSCERFLFLINCLRFDDKTARKERTKTDAFAHIRQVWNAFITTCRTSYTPSSYLTIDEQLLGFRGRCPFRTYIPNKPSKYGIKIMMLCDSSSKYMIDAIPYVGKSTDTNGLPLGIIRKNKQEIPLEMLEVRGRELHSSMFCFDRNKM